MGRLPLTGHNTRKDLGMVIDDIADSIYKAINVLRVEAWEAADPPKGFIRVVGEFTKDDWQYDSVRGWSLGPLDMEGLTMDFFSAVVGDKDLVKVVYDGAVVAERIIPGASALVAEVDRTWWTIDQIVEALRKDGHIIDDVQAVCDLTAEWKYGPAINGEAGNPRCRMDGFRLSPTLAQGFLAWYPGK